MVERTPDATDLECRVKSLEGKVEDLEKIIEAFRAKFKILEEGRKLMEATQAATLELLDMLGMSEEPKPEPKPKPKSKPRRKRRKPKKQKPQDPIYSIETLGPECEINTLQDLKILIQTIMLQLTEQTKSAKREIEGDTIITKENLIIFRDKLEHITVPENSLVKRTLQDYIKKINTILTRTQGDNISSHVHRLTYLRE